MESYKPYVILNAAMSLDGKIASKDYDSKLSSNSDLKRVHKLRSTVDAIMVGINTVIKDDPMLTVRYDYKGNPIRIIIDSKGRIDKESRIIKSSKDIKTIIVISEIAKDRVNELNSYGVNVIISGYNKVDLKALMPILYKQGIRRILLEGGGELNWSMLKERLVDEIIVTIEPVIIGGRDAITLVEGEGFSKVSDSIKIVLKDIERVNDEIILHYHVIN